jgi:DNA-directed RNA polymerase specialized sigma24 family protein
LPAETLIPAERNASAEAAVRNERKRLFDFIRRRVRTEEDAEDILQDVFYQLVASYNVTEPIEKLTFPRDSNARNSSDHAFFRIRSR